MDIDALDISMVTSVIEGTVSDNGTIDRILLFIDTMEAEISELVESLGDCYGFAA